MRAVALYATVCASAFAQSPVGGPPSPTTETTGDNQTSDIVVTARKVSERLQDVPLSVSAFTPAMLENQQITNLANLSSAVPSLTVTRNQTTANSAQLFLRGIGQDDSTPTNEPGVGIYIDDVYLARSQGALLDLIDVDRIEVLRGPQGTLYGRNTSGGAVKFVTLQPSLTDATGAAEITYGSFNEIDGRAKLSVPIIPGELAVKLDFLALTSDGFERRIDTGAEINATDRQAGRLAVLYSSGDVRDYFTADLTHDHSGLQQPTPVIPGTHTPLYGNPFHADPGSDVPDKNDYDGYGVANTLTYSLDPVVLKSITAYRFFDNSFITSLTGRPNQSVLNRDLHDHQFTQELQATTDLGALKGASGLFYLNEAFHNHDIFLLDTTIRQSTNSVAGYTDWTYTVFPRFDVTVGARYTYDHKNIGVTGLALGGVLDASASKGFYNTSEKVGLDYHVTDDVLTYFTFTTGYKAGAFQGFPQSNSEVVNQILNPEKAHAFEIGIKSDLIDRRLRINEALFHTDYYNLQLAIFNPATLGFVARNSDASISGSETEIIAVPFTGLSIYGNLALDTSHYIPPNATDPLLPLSSDRLKFLPDTSYRAGFNYALPEFSFGVFSVAGNFTRQGKTYFSYASQQPGNYQPAYSLFDLQGSFETTDGHYKLTVAGKNLGNQLYSTTGTVSGGGAFYYQPRRTVYVTLSAKF